MRAMSQSAKRPGSEPSSDRSTAPSDSAGRRGASIPTTEAAEIRALNEGSYTFSRESLMKSHVVEWLVENCPLPTTPFEIQNFIGVHDVDGNIFQYEIATALDEHGIMELPDKLTSERFRNEIRNYNG